MRNTAHHKSARTEGQPRRPHRVACAVLFAVFCLQICGCSRKADSDTPPLDPAAQPVTSKKTAPWFERVQNVPIPQSFHYSNPDSFEMPGIMGSGCSLTDLDNDGRLDIVLVPGDVRPDEAPAQAGQCCVLQQQADGSWQDVSDTAGLRVRGFGMGCFTADLDNDGDLDAVTTGARGVLLFRNDTTAGQIRMVDVTTESLISDARWATAAVMFDYDRDGWLDLFVTHYVDYFPGSICADGTGRRDYCGPQSFQGTADLLCRNLGGAGQLLRFSDVTVTSGIARAQGKGLGAAASDFNGDGRTDIYVANDMEPNFLWIQNAGGEFTEEAVLRGCAVDLQGRPQASMGVSRTDLDQDGRLDLFLTHLRGETNTWYRETTDGFFLDDTGRSGLGEPSRNMTGFGTIVADFDLDGLVDIAVVNGRVMRAPLLQPEPADGHWQEYAECNQLYAGIAAGRFTPHAADVFQEPLEVSRGLAAGDIDNDGDLDLLVASTAAPAALYKNVAERRGHWLQIRTVSSHRAGAAPGARITVAGGNRRLVAEVQPQTGYLSESDSRVHFGLGELSAVDWIEVQWPDGSEPTERFAGGAVDRVLELRQGAGQPVTSAGAQP